MEFQDQFSRMPVYTTICGTTERLERHPIQELNVSLLRHLQGIIDLDTEISDRAFQFAMTKQ